VFLPGVFERGQGGWTPCTRPHSILIETIKILLFVLIFK
jgi:hypothetical protein